MNILTVNEFNSYAPEVDTSLYSEPTISGMLSQATTMVEDYLGYTVYAEDISNELLEGLVTTEGDLLVYPAKVPVISVSSLSITKGTTTLNMTITDDNDVAKYNIERTRRTIRFPAGEIVLNGNTTFNNFYSLRGSQFYTKLSYRAGYEPSDLPSVFKLACTLYMREVLAEAMNTAGAKRISQGGISYEYFERDDSKSDLVKDAERLLNPYRRLL